MADSRVSNKQLLEAINGIAPAIAEALRNAGTAPATPEVTTAAPSNDGEVKVNPDYLANRKVAAQAHANKTGGEVVLYARRNLQGQTKLAFAQRGRYDTLKDRGLIGPVASYHPE